jgi:hypothetical protein
MSILSKLANLQASSATAAKKAMTDEQLVQCKAALVRDNRGYNVHANKFDIALPYRVAINYNDNWANFGNFKSADVAAAIGAIVSAGYFGEDARAGSYDQTMVEANSEFTAWLADARNTDIIARANGDLPKIHGTSSASADADGDENPF